MNWIDVDEDLPRLEETNWDYLVSKQVAVRGDGVITDVHVLWLPAKFVRTREHEEGVGYLFWWETPDGKQIDVDGVSHWLEVTPFEEDKE